MRRKIRCLGVKKHIYLQKIVSVRCLFAFVSEELHILRKWTSNMFCFPTATKWLSWIISLFGKQNQNILVVNYYKMKTAFVWDGAHSIWSWIVMCFGKMTQHGMNPNSFSPESLWGKICFQCIGEASQLLVLLSWMSGGASRPLKTAQPFSWRGCDQHYPGGLPVWRTGIAGWGQPCKRGMWEVGECVPTGSVPDVPP